MRGKLNHKKSCLHPAGILLLLIMVSCLTGKINVSAEEDAIPGDDAAQSSGMTQDSTEQTTLSGRDGDIAINGISIGTAKAGQTVSIKFTINGQTNDSGKYKVDRIKQVYPDIGDDFPAVSNDEAYKIVSGTSSTLQCEYSLLLKDSLETGYVNIPFCIIYTKSASAGSTKKYDSEYQVQKKITFKVTAVRKSTTTKKITGDNSDVSLKVQQNPTAEAGKAYALQFQAVSRKYNIKSVVPVMDDTFPFQSTSEAYKTISGHGKSVACKYDFQVKKDISTGYTPVTFEVTYMKSGVSCKVQKKIQVELQGKKKKKASGQKNKKHSAPRFMVTGYQTDPGKISQNQDFSLTVYLKNTSNETVKNVKLTLTSEDGKLLPRGGTNTSYLSRIAAGQSTSVVFPMHSDMELEAKPYQITVSSEYENGNDTAYTGSDELSIPVYLKDQIIISDVTQPKKFTVGSDGTLKCSLNNIGFGSIQRVIVKVKGKDFTASKKYVGKLKAGEGKKLKISLHADQMTPESENGDSKIIVTYLNEKGEKVRYVQKTKIIVYKEAVEDLKLSTKSKSSKHTVPVSVICFAGLILIAGMGVFMMDHRKKWEEMS